jgi:hypothetical protein
MPYNRSGFRVVSWMLLLGAASLAMAREDAKTEVDHSGTVRGRPINRGYVLLNGRYLPPPYVVAQRGHDLVINDHVISAEGFAEWSGEEKGRREDSAERPGRRRAHGQRKITTRVRQHLHGDDLLIVVEDKLAGFVPESAAWTVFDVLLSDAPAEEKVQALVDEGAGWIDDEGAGWIDDEEADWVDDEGADSIDDEGADWINSAQWARIVQSFEPTPELVQHVLPLLEQYRAVVEANEAAHHRLVFSAAFLSKPVRYGATVAVMVAVVMAMGSLLNSRPEKQGRWRDIDGSTDRVAMVARNVGLFAVLGGFDLLLTIVPQQAGGFLEFNPLGGQLSESPLFLAAFKMTILLAACLILVTLRRYRGAQIASWWTCLVYTVLTFRWLTYNSLFLT